MEETNFIDMDLKEECLDIDVKKEFDAESLSFMDESEFQCASVKEEFIFNDQSDSSALAQENSNFEAVFVKEEPLEYQDQEILEQMKFVPILVYANGIDGQENKQMNSESPSFKFVSSENSRNLNRGNVRNAMKDPDGNEFSLQGAKLMKTLMCSICKFKTNSRHNLNNHLLGHSGINFFKCAECDFETNEEALFKTHSLNHSETNMFKQSKFDYRTKVKNNLLKMADNGCKNNRNTILLNTKLKMINLYNEGISQAEIGRRLSIPRSTVQYIMMRHKQKILNESKSATPVIRYKRQRNDLHVDMEKLLRVWINDQKRRNVSLSRAVIQSKARSLFDVLKAKKGEAAKNAEFGASKGWFARFKKRANKGCKISRNTISLNTKPKIINPNKSCNIISLNTKLKMINLYNEGISQAEIGRRLSIPRSTVQSIMMRHKQKILNENKSATPVIRCKRQRNDLHVDMEKLLNVWIDDQKGRNVTLSPAVIQSKARSLFDVLKAKKGEAAKNAEFGASKGWFARFKKRANKGCKISRNTISLNTKPKMINLYNDGISQAEIGRRLSIPRSTVCSIMKHKQQILDEIKGATPVIRYKRQRNDLHVDMEKLLKVWIDDQKGRNVTLSQAVIQRKARSLFDVLKAKKGEAAKNAEFGASKGWFSRFKKRENICSIKVRREAASANKTSETFPTELAKIIDEGDYSKDQIFYVDETNLFWKKLPSRTFISKEENSMHGFKASKDRLTLQLGANASGTFKLKPMLIYCAENPRALKNYYKSSLPVIWKSNAKACVTVACFEEWYTYHFIPAVEGFCREQNIEFKILLIINDAPSHPRTLNKVNPNVKLIVLPPSINSIPKPMDQCVIAAFKAYYLRRTFANLIAAIDKEEGDGQEMIKSFWKSFNILDGIKLIRDAWQDVKITTLQGAWKNLCPQLLNNLVEGFEDPVPEITNGIVSMAKQLKLDANQEDVAELLDSHSQPLNNEDLLELDRQREEVIEEASISEVRTGLTAEILLKAIRHFEAGMKLLEKHDPNFERSSKVNSIILNAYARYSEMYRQMKEEQSKK